MAFVAVAVLFEVVLASFGLSPVVAAWVELLVAGNVDSCSSHTAFFVFQVPASVPLLVWGWSFCLTFPDYFVQSWHTFYRPESRVSKLGRRYMQPVGYIPSYCDPSSPHLQHFSYCLHPLVVLVGVGRTLVLAASHLLRPLAG